VLEVDNEADKKKINSVYRKGANTGPYRHPDKGGCPEAFRYYAQVKDVLVSYCVQFHRQEDGGDDKTTIQMLESRLICYYFYEFNGGCFWLSNEQQAIGRLAEIITDLVQREPVQEKPKSEQTALQLEL
jgi:hypothetical protein